MFFQSWTESTLLCHCRPAASHTAREDIQCKAMPNADSIDGVIDQLTAIIAAARTNASRLGYFPALYRRVTRAVKKGIAAGRFDDPARMERLDVIFANRYLAAYDAWQSGAPVSRSWALAFNGAARTDRAITQHLLLGMNAHINLDLAVAAAEAAPAGAIHGLQRDFLQINRILAEQIDDVQDAISTVAPLMWLLDIAGGTDGRRLIEFSLEKARDAAWMQALVLAGLEPALLPPAIEMADDAVTLIGEGVLNPPGVHTRAIVWAIVAAESASVARIIDALQ